MMVHKGDGGDGGGRGVGGGSGGSPPGATVKKMLPRDEPIPCL